MAHARLLFGAPVSGAGKTTVTCGIMHALVRRGLRVAACKCGPDYIDPMFHQQVIGAQSRNLDLFFSSEDQVRALVARSARESDVVVIEGAMGYYDGIAVSDEASAWHVAQATGTPAVLVVNGRGRARSIAAEIAGFERFRQPSQVAGVVLNRVSGALYPRLKDLIEAETGVRVYGYLPQLDDCSLQSRHLGLVTAGEVADLRAKLDVLAEAVEQCVDVDGLLELAEAASFVDLPAPAGGGDDMLEESCFGERPTGSFASCGRSARAIPAPSRSCVSGVAASEGKLTDPGEMGGVGESLGVEAFAPSMTGGGTRWRGNNASRVSIAVAWDDGFCFYYDDALRLLEELGVRIVRFSPLADDRLPEGVSGLYLGGGYPELHAEELSRNVSMRESVAQAVRSGMPTIAECGGFLYLHEWLEGSDGADYPQVGVVPGRAFGTGKLGRFGYVTLAARRDGLLAQAGEELRAHEFHYWDSENPGDAYHARKPQSSRSWDCCVSTPTLHAGFPHLYLPAHPHAAARFVEACRAYVPCDKSTGLTCHMPAPATGGER